MFRTFICLFMVAAALSWTPQLQAGHGCAGSDGCGCHVECPQCHHYCKLSVDKEKVKNYCWEVECKPICVPRVHFPWECGCPPKCAKVIHVNVLKKKEYECEACKYTWTPVPEECPTCGSQAGCCDSGCAACDMGCGAADDVVVPMDSQPKPAPEPPLTGQRPTWFQSAAGASKAKAALPARFLRAAKQRMSD